jgi:NAD(P)-dependent dehydrogenase (short-subunit alcohol dehydrogenase family)
MGRLARKIAVVLGGGGTAIGRATMRRFLDEGATVISVDRTKDRDAALAAAEELGLATTVAFIDIFDGQSYRSAFDEIVSAHGRIDALINVAVAGRGPDPGDWEWTLRGSFAPVYYGTGYGAPAMATQGGGSILNVASVSGVVLSPSIRPVQPDVPMEDFPIPHRGIGSYGPSKAAVVHFTKEMAVLWGRRQVRVNVVAPGFMATPFTLAAITGERRSEIEQAIPLGSLGRAEDIASVAAFFASDDSAYVTGQLVVVDGGFSAARH